MQGFIRFSAALGLGLLASFALADAPPHSTVHFHDLDFKKPADIEKLHARLRRAANRVCVTFEGVSLRERTAFDRCTIMAINDAVHAIGAPELTRYHHERTGEDVPRLAQNR